MYTRGELGIFLRRLDVIEIGLKQKGNVLQIVQPTMCSTLSVYDIQPPIAGYVSELAATTLFLVLGLGYAHAQLRSFYPLSTFEGSHVRKNTRLSPHAQVQFRILERRSLGTRLPLVHMCMV